MVFANDHLLSRELHQAELAGAGRDLDAAEQAVAEHEELVRRHFMTQEVVLGSKKFAALHQAMVQRRHVPLRAARTRRSLCRWRRCTGCTGANGSVFPHTLIVAGENSQVTVIDRFESAEPTSPASPAG